MTNRLTTLLPFLLLAFASTACKSPLDAAARPDEQVLYVEAHKGVCYRNSNEPARCLLARETSTDSWSLFGEEIQGFSYRPGFRYKLAVRIQPVERPLMDMPTRTVTLVRVIDFHPVP